MRQFIIKLPEGEKFELLSDEAKTAVQAVKGQFPSGRVSNSSAVGGYEIKLVMCDSDAETLQNIFDYGFPITDEEGETTLFDLMLDWTVLAEESVFTDPEVLLYLNPMIEYDEEGEVLSETPADLSMLQTYAGKKWHE